MKKYRYNQRSKRALTLEKFIIEKDIGCGMGVELGVLKGETLFYLGKKFPELNLIGIDLWQEIISGDKNDEGFRSYSKEFLDRYYQDVMVMQKSYPNVAILKQDTAEAAYNYSNKQFDFIFVDADHTYEGVSRDLSAWVEKIKFDGYIIGHDFHMAGVRKAVEEFFITWEEGPSNVWMTAKTNLK